MKLFSHTYGLTSRHSNNYALIKSEKNTYELKGLMLAHIFSAFNIQRGHNS